MEIKKGRMERKKEASLGFCSDEECCRCG